MPVTRVDLSGRFQVKPGRRLRLKDYDPGWAGGEELRQLKSDQLKDRAREYIEQNLAALADAQERLYANDVYSVLVVLQAMDAAGKDGTIKHVMSGLNPQGCQVFAFKRPSDEDLDHNFLWRYAKCLPERGRIGIFNRSYYEETLVVSVHPEMLDRQRLPPGKRGQRSSGRSATTTSTAFERHLTRNGTLILKFFLNVSKKEQKKRFLERLDTPDKQLEVLAGGSRGAEVLGRLPAGVRGARSRTRAPSGRRGGSSRRITSGWRGLSCPRCSRVASRAWA